MGILCANCSGTDHSNRGGCCALHDPRLALLFSLARLVFTLSMFQVSTGLPSPCVPSPGLGGNVQSGVFLQNNLGANSVALMCELPRTTAAVSDLRLTGNTKIGGAGCVKLLSALQGSIPPKTRRDPNAPPDACLIKTLHLDECGLTRDDVPKFLTALDPVWCLHALKVDAELDAAEEPGPAGSGILGALGKKSPSPPPPKAPSPLPPAGRKAGLTAEEREQEKAAARIQARKRGQDARRATQGKGGGGRLLTLQQKMGMAKLLEDNKTMGVRRVESWRLSCSLQEARAACGGRRAPPLLSISFSYLLRPYAQLPTRTSSAHAIHWHAPPPPHSSGGMGLFDALRRHRL